jgi:hypothetical protein
VLAIVKGQTDGRAFNLQYKRVVGLPLPSQSMYSTTRATACHSLSLSHSCISPQGSSAGCNIVENVQQARRFCSLVESCCSVWV